MSQTMSSTPKKGRPQSLSVGVGPSSPSSPDLFNDSDVTPLPSPLPPLSSLPQPDPPRCIIAAGNTPSTPQLGQPRFVSNKTPTRAVDGTGTLTKEGDIPSEVSVTMRRTSCSRKNFGVQLCRYLFPPEVRATSNVSGSMNKQQLDTLKVAAIRRAIFALWPLKAGEEEKQEWRKVVVAIDEANRRLKRKK